MRLYAVGFDFCLNIVSVEEYLFDSRIDKIFH